MKTKFNILMAFVGLLILSTACKKEFLDKPVYGVLALDDYFQTPEEIEEGLMSCYDVLQWAYTTDWNTMYAVKTFPSDETHTGGGNSSDQPPYQQLDNFSYTSENAPIAHAYRAMYFGIMRANGIINTADESDAELAPYVAEAKALRAYFYFELVSMFGNVPLRLSLPSPEEYNQAGADASEIYAQIHKDLDEAIAGGLKMKDDYSAGDKFRMSKGAAIAIKGKAYLYQKEYAMAAAEFEKIISGTAGNYALHGDYSTLFFKENEYNIESIFEVGYVTTEGYDWGTFQWGGHRSMENNINWQLMGPRGDNFDPGTSGLRGGWGFAYPTKEIHDAFVAENDLVRKQANVMNEADLAAFGGSWTGEAWGYEGFIRLKYGTWEGETNLSEGAVPELNYGTNVRLIRYADVLLMAAEAHVQNGAAGLALPLINEVRARVSLPDLASVTMDDIKTERRLELAFEGHRFMDLVRWGDASSVLLNQGFEENGDFVEGKHELFPMPYAEISNNNLLQQNPKW